MNQKLNENTKWGEPIYLSDNIIYQLKQLEELYSCDRDETIAKAINFTYQREHPLSEENMEKYRKKKISPVEQAASSIAMALLKRNHEKGIDINIPSLEVAIKGQKEEEENMNQELNIDTNVNINPAGVRTAYEESLHKHIAAVREAGRRLGVPVEQLNSHDNSKWGIDEFDAYARQFHGDKGDPTGYSLAWLHHVHNNPHHWQYWLHPVGYIVTGTDIDHGALRMPDNFATEMVADWLGASYCYTGSWDMTNWLQKNWSEIRLHTETRKYVYDVLLTIDKGKTW